MAVRFNTTRIQYLDENGDPYSGGLMNYYETGTSTRLDTYSDNALSSANANPVVADSAGRFGDIFLKGQDYKVVFTDSAGTTIWTADPVHGIITDRSVAAKTGAYTVTTADNGKLITGDASGGDFTITLPAAATAGGTFEVTINNIGSSGTVTVDGDGSETIDGSTTLILNHQYDSYLLRCDGTVWHTVIFLNKAAVLDGINDLTEDAAPDVEADFIATYDTSASLAKKVLIGNLLPFNYIGGFGTSNGTDSDHDINIADGECRDASNTDGMILSGGPLVKQIDATWAVGSAAGGLDTGSVANSTMYAVWLIKRIDTDVVDALFSTSFTSPTMPTNYTLKRLIGYVVTDGSANILAYTQSGNHFEMVLTIADVSDSTMTDATFEAGTFSVPPSSIGVFVASLSNTSDTDN